MEPGFGFAIIIASVYLFVIIYISCKRPRQRTYR